jgi:hypothetical protein
MNMRSAPKTTPARLLVHYGQGGEKTGARCGGSGIAIMAQRCHFWDDITARLDRLANKITANDRMRIETEIAAKVPRPTPAKYKDQARRSAQFLN